MRKKNAFCKLLSIFSPTIICLTETWLDNSIIDTAIFSGHSYTLVLRSDRMSGCHGGILIAVENKFLSSTHIRFSSKSEIDCTFVMESPQFSVGIILFFLPPRGSRYYVNPIAVENRLQTIFRDLENEPESEWKASIQWLVLGDFNHPNVDWSSVSSLNSEEQNFLDFLTECLFFTQIIDQPTHKGGNILDIGFCSHPENWDFSVRQSSCSDHYSVILSYEGFITHDSSNVFSMHSFDAEKCAQSTAVLKLLANDCHSSRPGFISLCYKLLDTALDKCFSKKRRKRVNTPFFYSSATMHCLNKLNTAKRGRKQNVATLEEELGIFIEMDKQVFLNSVKTFTTNEAFALLKKLNGRNTFPSKVCYKRRVASRDLDKANLFNQFFNSVFLTKTSLKLQESLCNFNFGNRTKLSEVRFSILDIHEQLLQVPDSSIATCDGLPRTI